MSVFAGRLVVGTTPVELTAAAPADAQGSGQSVALLDCDVDLYVGATNAVTTSGGARLPAHTPFAADVDDGDHLWLVAGSAGTAHVVRTGV